MNQENSEPPQPDPASPIQPKQGPRLGLFWLGITAICLVIMGFSSLVNTKLDKRVPQGRSASLPKLHQIQHELQGVERKGNAVTTDRLAGKVRVYAYIYTICPHGCAAVIGEMLKLNQKFGDRDDFFQVSISVVPERDTAPILEAYAKGIGLNENVNWWFLTGEQDKLWSFMTDELKMEPAKAIPEEERLNPLDIYTHDLRLVLVDRAGFVRGYYAVFHPQSEIAEIHRKKLQEDAEYLLNTRE